MKYKKISITWLDSKGITGWEHIEDIEPMPPAECKSIGFLVDETKKYITIAQTISDSQLMGRTTIPKCSIISRG